MTWLERYIAGEHEAVWAEMVLRGPQIVDDAGSLRDAEAVAKETMLRIRHNLELLEGRLRQHGFRFAADDDRDWPHPALNRPNPDAPSLLGEIEAAVGGRFPLSIRAFIEHVGWVDFNGDLPGWSPRLSDGLQIHTDLTGLADLLVDMIEHGYYDDPGVGATQAHLELSADHLHKANISGGPPYGLAVPDASADGRWLFDDLHPDHTFVEYLRVTIRDGGLPGWRRTAGEGPPPILEHLVDGLIRF
ncbi:MAG: hypothetical protein QOF73_5544 [Thermomicrobiales bacterium]|nr:hypothetical protein [Thermomicrobiales bacterium]